MERSALISDCGLYRHWLSRTWAPGERVCWIMLNPSTANAVEDDPTIRRCIGFSREFGFGGLVVVNLFDFISSDPRALVGSHIPSVSNECRSHIAAAASKCSMIIAAWGAFSQAVARQIEVLDIISDRNVHCLKVTKEGAPSHPLYLAKTCRPVLFRAAKEGE